MCRPSSGRPRFAASLPPFTNPVRRCDVTFFKLSLGVLGGAAAVLWAMPSDITAQRVTATSGMQVLENRSDAASAYWTPARMAAAQPVAEKIPLASPLNNL